MFSVWAFSWAKWPQTADSALATSIFGTYVKTVGKPMYRYCQLSQHTVQEHACSLKSKLDFGKALGRQADIRMQQCALIILG